MGQLLAQLAVSKSDVVKNRMDALLGLGLILLGLVVVVLKQAWRLSHRGGFDLFSVETLRELEPYIVMWVVFVVGYLAWLFFKDRDRRK
jgi:hypothetical protein